MAQPALPHVDGATVTHRFVDVDGLTVHVAESGEGQPLILLHTSFQHWYAWRDVIPALAERFHVICPDLRGCGWTSAPPTGYEKERLAADIVALLDVLGLGRVWMAGHGLGGFVGFLACLRHPERFQRYLAIGIPHPWIRLRPGTASMLWRAWYQVLIATPEIGSRLLRHNRRFVRWLLGGSKSEGSAGHEHRQGWSEDELWTFVDRLQEPTRARAMVQLYRTFLLQELLPLVRGRYRSLRLETPTRILFGTRDVFFPVSALAGYEPYADDLTVELVPGGSHFLPQHDPKLVSERAISFFGDE
jgi:pimeloyl-ACP methyl ester carboxylesterase